MTSEQQMREQRDAIHQFLKHYVLSHSNNNRDDGGLLLVDKLTPDSDKTIERGNEEIEHLTDELADLFANMQQASHQSATENVTSQRDLHLNSKSEGCCCEQMKPLVEALRVNLDMTNRTLNLISLGSVGNEGYRMALQDASQAGNQSLANYEQKEKK